MADETYNNQAVYHKRGGDEVVIANGGVQTVESGGKIDGESGGRMDADAAFSFYFDGQAFTGENMKAIMRATNAVIITNGSTGGTVLSDAGGSAAPVLDSQYGIVWLSCSDAMTNGSCRLYSGLRGQTLFIGFTLSDGNNGSIHVHASGADGFTGVKLYGSNGIELSTVAIRQSNASWGWIQLFCATDGCWSILSADANNVTEYLGA